MRKNWLLIALSLTLLFVASCKRSDKVATTEKETKSTDVLKAEITALDDSTDLYWDRMMQSDDEKLESIRYLINEMEYAGAYNRDKIKQLDTLQKALPAKRFDRSHLGNYERITAYDNATDSLLYSVRELAYSSSIKEKYPRIELLLDDIKVKDDSIILYRANYDRRAKQYNLYLKENRESLANVDSSFEKMETKALFELNAN